jgi:pilus assembly protein CpaF
MAAAAASNPLQTDKLLDAKVRLHRRLIEEINLQAMERLPEDEIRAHITQLVTQYILVERLALNQQELNDFVSEILDEMTGLGPLEPLLKDPSIADILINGHECVYVERGGVLEPCGVRFKDEAHLLRIINKIVSAVGRRVDESHPMCDARLLDGSRVNVAVRPIGVDGPLVSIRKFSKKPFSLNKLVEVGAIRPPMAEVLAAAVKARVTTIISGGTGSGKTTMLRSAFSPSRMLPSCSCSSRMWAAWRRGRPTSKARARSASASWSRTRCACVPTASSSASAAARRRSTCCKP